MGSDTPVMACVRCQSVMLCIKEDVDVAEVNEVFKDLPTTGSLIDRILLAATFQGASDAPLCEICMQSAVSELCKEIETLKQELQVYRETADIGSISSSHQGDADELSQLEAELSSLITHECKLKSKLSELESEEKELITKSEDIFIRFVDSQRDLLDNESDYCSIERQIAYASNELKKLKKMNIMQEAFKIEVSIESAQIPTINGLRIGRQIDDEIVPWTEIAGALGQVVLFLDVVIKKTGISLNQYKLIPRGNSSLIVQDGNQLELFPGEGGLTRFFSGRKFDSALSALLAVMSEILVFFQRQDPSLRIPYKIENSKIGGLSIQLQFNSEIEWTKAMKLFSINLKYLLALLINNKSFNLT
jgi:beclin